MSDRHRFRTLIVSGGALLALGVAGAAPGAATPVTVTPVDSNYPMGGGRPGQAAQDPGKQAEKAEKFGGSLTTRLVDLGASVVKCGLSVAVSTVRCDM
ncbi:hypothetical protein NDR87_18325 [Nocardia sp. CDC159]|uniref:Uncharacterized protein n=1 Tax=Nocardia pulmonis TaxID=2951408 RepID=A0A9X2IYJ0_9NOCA|nr:MULTISPECIES: hypothetical protein [Nocardia]MCM6775704.1 hypothetical protein [Nocardia pulmonis]MCM6788320.1 hypothetical protein [Nocardia sp. CDC159]